MKKYLFFAVTLIFVGCGATKVNVSDKYIGNVTSYYEGQLPEYSSDFSVFWDYILNNNQSFQEYIKEGSGLKNKTLKKFWNEVNSVGVPYEPEDTILSKDIETAKMFAGSKYDEYIKQISFLPDYEINAFATPNGYIYLHYGIANLFTDGWNEYSGVIAHEMAHVLLKHAERHQLDIKKRERKDDIARGIAAGLLGAGAITGALSMANSGAGANAVENWTNSYTENAMELGTSISKSLSEYSYIKKYEYGREQEIEADIVAILFLKWLNTPPEPYINLLDKMPKNQPMENGTHPDYKFRISFLNKYIGKPDKTFNVDGRIYHLDGKQVKEFLKKNPTAVEIPHEQGIIETNKKDKYDNVYD